MGLDLAHNETVFGKPIFTINSGNLSHWWVQFDLENVNSRCARWNSSICKKYEKAFSTEVIFYIVNHSTMIEATPKAWLEFSNWFIPKISGKAFYCVMKCSENFFITKTGLLWAFQYCFYVRGFKTSNESNSVVRFPRKGWKFLQATTTEAFWFLFASNSFVFMMIANWSNIFNYYHRRFLLLLTR